MNDTVQVACSDLSKYSEISQIIIGFAGLIVACLTFILAIKIHKEFLKNHAKSKQVEKMSDLVAFLNNTRISIEFADFYPERYAGGTRHPIYYNIFEISDLLYHRSINHENSKHIRLDSYDEYPVFLDSTSHQIMNIKDYIDHPFIPRQIADKLNDFYVKRVNEIKYEQLCEEGMSVVILKSSNEKSGFNTLNVPDCEALKSWLGFKSHAYNLTKSVGDWFVNNGIKDYNIRIDYKNLEPIRTSDNDGDLTSV